MTATNCPINRRPIARSSSAAGSSGAAAGADWPDGVRALMADIAARLAPQRFPSRVLGVAAVLFMVSTAVHLGVWAVDGGGWGGSVSWRKPVLFSFSFAAISWSMAWLLDRLPDRRKLASAIAVSFVVSSIIEVGLISMQTWRGRASHFNVAEPGDALIFSLMGIMAGIISLAILVASVWSLISRPASRLDRLAAYAGFGLVISGLGVGSWLIQIGTAYADEMGVVPEQVINGEAGVVSYPHGVAFHGVQVFMVAAAVAGALGMTAVAARQMLRSTVVAYSGLMGIAFTQAVVGRSLTDLAPVSWGFLALTLVFGALAARIFVRGVRTWSHDRSEPTAERVGSVGRSGESTRVDALAST